MQLKYVEKSYNCANIPLTLWILPQLIFLIKKYL